MTRDMALDLIRRAYARGALHAQGRRLEDATSEEAEMLLAPHADALEVDGVILDHLISVLAERPPEPPPARLELPQHVTDDFRLSPSPRAWALVPVLLALALALLVIRCLA